MKQIGRELYTDQTIVVMPEHLYVAMASLGQHLSPDPQQEDSILTDFLREVMLCVQDNGVTGFPLRVTIKHEHKISVEKGKP